MQDWIWKENRDLAEIRFRFKDKEQPMSYTQTLASNLLKFSPAGPFLPSHSELLVRPTVPSTYSPEDITHILDLLTPANLIVLVSATELGSLPTVEPVPAPLTAVLRRPLRGYRLSLSTHPPP